MSSSPDPAAIQAYLQKHEIRNTLNSMTNQLVKTMPDDPLAFMINHLVNKGGSEGMLLMDRLKELRATLAKDAQAFEALQAEVTKLKEQKEKDDYRILHLKKNVDSLASGAAPAAPAASVAAPAASSASAAVPTKIPVGHTAYSWSHGSAKQPIGHTAYSWTAGSTPAAAANAPAPAPAAAVAAAPEFPDTPPLEKYSRGRVRIMTLRTAGLKYEGEGVAVAGWVRTMRKQSVDLHFLEVNDGSCMANMQVVLERKNYKDMDKAIELLATGCAVAVTGKVVESPAKGQSVELHATAVEVVGGSDAANYPLAKKRHTLEHLRSVSHLRPRTNTMGAVMRVRNACAAATHKFFQSNNFMYVHSPLITASDCEGAGEMFQVTTLDLNKVPTDKAGKVDYSQDFFGSNSYLTVSGQLNAEYYACAMCSVYTFGPTFRAENSHTTRHLAEFWMIEPEIAFADLTDDMNLAEDYLKFCFKYVIANCAEDMAFLDKMYDKGLVERLEKISAEPFERCTYTRAVELCQDAEAKGRKWENKPEWGEELHTEHERYLAEDVFQKPVIVYNYPKACKAFYMRRNDGEPEGRETVAAMDVLFPKVGEMVGGSQREERLDVLEKAMKESGLNPEEYSTYLDTRRYGTQKHAGFGLGFERLVMYSTGMDNIRDVIPFPRWPGNCAC